MLRFNLSNSVLILGRQQFSTTTMSCKECRNSLHADFLRQGLLYLERLAILRL